MLSNASDFIKVFVVALTCAATIRFGLEFVFQDDHFRQTLILNFLVGFVIYIHLKDCARTKDMPNQSERTTL